MAKKRLNKSISTFTNDPISRRVDQVRRDDDIVKTPKITIEDIDFAMMSYIRDVIQPTIIENEAQVEVPVMYANGETFAQIQPKAK
jgi:hypothetical protein